MATKPVKKASKKPATKKPIKKAAAKKAPAKEKVVAKKAAAKKAPAAKKTVAKKAVAKKAVAKKAVAKKTVVKRTVKRAPVKKAAVSQTVSYAPANEWLNKEAALPDFLQTKNLEVKKTPVATQQYVRTKKQSPKLMLVALVLLMSIFGASAYFLASDNSDDLNSGNVSATAGESTEQSDSNVSNGDSELNESKDGLTPTPASTPSKSADSKGDSSGETSPTPSSSKDPNSLIQAQSPRTFLSSQSEQMATLKWLEPKNMDRIVAFELFVKTAGQANWVLISTVTTEQLEIEVELTPSDTTTQFRVASLLDNDKKIYNKTIITLPGSLS